MISDILARVEEQCKTEDSLNRIIDLITSKESFVDKNNINKNRVNKISKKLKTIIRLEEELKVHSKRAKESVYEPDTLYLELHDDRLIRSIKQNIKFLERFLFHHDREEELYFQHILKTNDVNMLYLYNRWKYPLENQEKISTRVYDLRKAPRRSTGWVLGPASST